MTRQQDDQRVAKAWNVVVNQIGSQDMKMMMEYWDEGRQKDLIDPETGYDFQNPKELAGRSEEGLQAVIAFYSHPQEAALT